MLVRYIVIDAGDPVVFTALRCKILARPAALIGSGNGQLWA